jgi:uncharacterized protein
MRLDDDSGRDFPFYRGVPVGLSTAQWWLLIGSVAVGFALLIAPIAWPGGEVGAFLPAVLFSAIPLAALAWASKGRAGSLFGPVGWREVKLMAGFALLNIVVTFIVGGVVRAAFGASPNPAIATASQLSTGGLVVFLSRTAVQLVGEEVLTVVPMLALLHLLVARAGMSRSAGLFWAWVSSAVVFGLLHLPTYQWDWVQCLVIIGTARLVLSLAYIKTKNLWVSAGAHILNDWVLIVINVLGSRLVQQ